MTPHLRSILGLAAATGLVFATGCEPSTSSSSDPCAANPCQNGSTCNAGVCECKPGYSGASCEIFTSECGDITCANGGVCANDACSCADGYEGTTCATESRPKYLGSYTMARSCGGGSTISQDVQVTAGSGKAQIKISDFAHDFQGEIYATLNGATTFEIPKQTHTRSAGSCKGTFSVKGSGTFNATDNSMSGAYDLTLESTTDSECSSTPPNTSKCTVTFTRL